MVNKIIGIDLGGTNIKLAIINTEGNIEYQWSIPTNIAENGKNIVYDIISSIKIKLIEKNLNINDIKGIGMGSPGQIDYINGTVKGAYNLGWGEIQEIKSVFEKEFNIPFYIENDANVAALGEKWKGAGENSTDVVFITLGTGVGGGIIVNDKLLRGIGGAAGEIGHIVMPNNKFKCTCGNIGCLETVTSATGIVRIAEEKFKDNKIIIPTKIKDMIEKKSLTAKDIFDFAKEGDEFSIEVIDIFSDYLGLACAQLGSILNPKFIIIGGGVSAAGEHLLNEIIKKFNEYSFKTVKNTTKIRIATLGNDAGIIGAASLVL